MKISYINSSKYSFNANKNNKTEDCDSIEKKDVKEEKRVQSEMNAAKKATFITFGLFSVVTTIYFIIKHKYKKFKVSKSA